CSIFTCSWSGRTAPGAKRINAVTSPVSRSNNSVLTSQPGKRVFCHSILAGRTTWECWSADFCDFGVTASIANPPLAAMSRPDDRDPSRTRRAAPLHFTVPNRRLEGEPGVPGKIDPGVLRYLGDERVDHGSAHGLGVDGREMRLGQHLAYHLCGFAGIDEIIDDQHTLAAPAADADDAARHVLEHLEFALRDVVVARDAHGLAQPHAERARSDRGGAQAAAGEADDRLERAGASQPPRERARIAMELIPRDRKGFLRLWLRLLERLRHRFPRPERAVAF